MSLSAKNSDMKFPVLSRKMRTRNVRPLLDMNLQVIEVNNKMLFNIQVDELQVTDLFRYFLEKSLKNHFGFVCYENGDSFKELSSNKEERVSVYRIDRKSALSEREVEILQKLSKGWTNSEIADHFMLTVSTVKNHLQSIYLKLGVTNRFKAVAEYRKLFENVNKITSEK